eukprot:COSAG02_NODE_47731_length_339_cov_0.633333_1_plen_98_part_10
MARCIAVAAPHRAEPSHVVWWHTNTTRPLATILVAERIRLDLAVLAGKSGVAIALAVIVASALAETGVVVSAVCATSRVIVVIWAFAQRSGWYRWAGG